MKLLQLDMYFKLPDNFEGDHADALQLLADYAKETKGTEINRKFDILSTDLNDSYSKVKDKIFSSFWRTVLEGKKIFGVIQKDEYNPITREWTRC